MFNHASHFILMLDQPTAFPFKTGVFGSTAASVQFFWDWCCWQYSYRCTVPSHIKNLEIEVFTY